MPAGSPPSAPSSCWDGIGEQPGELTVAELATDAGMPTSTAYRSARRARAARPRPARRRTHRRARDATGGAGARRPRRALRERLVDAGASGDGATLGAAGGDGDPDRAVRARGRSCCTSSKPTSTRSGCRTRSTAGRRCTAARPARSSPHTWTPASARGCWRRSGRARLERELDRIRRAGFAYTVGELDAGAAALAVPILDRRGRIVAGLSIAGPAERSRRSARAIQTGRALCRADDRARLPALTTARVRVHVAPRERNDLRLSCHLSGTQPAHAARPGAADRPSPARRQARRRGPRPRRAARPRRAEPRRAVERRLRARGDHGRAGHGRRVGAAVHAAADARDHRRCWCCW